MASNGNQKTSERSWNPQSGRSLTDILTLAEIERLDGSFKVMQQRHGDIDDVSFLLLTSSEEDRNREAATYLSQVRQEAAHATLFLDEIKELAEALQHISDHDDSCEYRYLRYDAQNAEHVTKTIAVIASERKTLETALSSSASPSSRLDLFRLFYYHIKVSDRGHYQALLSTAKQVITEGYVERRIQGLPGLRKRPEEPEEEHGDSDNERTDVTPRLERELIKALTDLKIAVGDRDFAGRDVTITMDGKYIIDDTHRYDPYKQRDMISLACQLSEAVPEDKRMRIVQRYDRVREALGQFEPFAQDSVTFLEDRLSRTISPLSVVHSAEYDPKRKIDAYIEHAVSFRFFRSQILGNIDALITHAQAGLQRKREGDRGEDDINSLINDEDNDADSPFDVSGGFDDSYDELVDSAAGLVPEAFAPEEPVRTSPQEQRIREQYQSPDEPSNVIPLRPEPHRAFQDNNRVQVQIAVERGQTFGVSRPHEEREAERYRSESRDTAPARDAREVSPASPQPARDQQRHQEPAASHRVVPPPTRERYNEYGYYQGSTNHLPIRINLSPLRFQPKQPFMERAREWYYNTFWRTHDEANPTPMPIDTWPVLVSAVLGIAAAIATGEYSARDPDVRSYAAPIAIGSGVAAFHASLYVLEKGVTTIANAVGNHIYARRKAREERRSQKAQASNPQPMYVPPDLTSLDSILNVDTEQVAALNEFARQGKAIIDEYYANPTGFQLQASHVYWLRQALQQAEYVYRSREGQSMEAFERTGDKKYYDREGANEIAMTMSKIQEVWDVVHGIVRDHTHLLSQGSSDPLYRKNVQRAAEIVERSTSLLR